MKTALGILVLILTSVPVAASAQPVRVLVSGDGKDDNNCGEKKACRTLAMAFAKVAPGGEVLIMDSGPFSGATITKSLTLTSAPGVRGIQMQASEIIVIAAPTDVVRLRNLDLRGESTIIGVQIQVGRALQIDRCDFSGFGDAVVAQTGVTTITRSTFSNLVNSGVVAQSVTPGEPARISIADSSFVNCATGVEAYNDGIITATRCAFSSNTIGVSAAPLEVGSRAEIQLDRCQISGNLAAVTANNSWGGASSIVRLSNCVISGNASGVWTEWGGRIESFGNNTIAENSFGDVAGDFTPVSTR